MNTPDPSIEPLNDEDSLLEKEGSVVQNEQQNLSDVVMHRRHFGQSVGALFVAGAGLAFTGTEALGAKANRKKSVEFSNEASVLFQEAKALHAQEGATENVRKLLNQAGKAAREHKDLVMFKILDAGRDWFQFPEDVVVREKLRTFAAAYPHQDDAMQLSMAAFDAPHLMQMGIDFDQYELVHGVYDNAKTTLAKEGFKPQMKELGKLNGTATVLLKEYEPLKKALDAKPDDPTANLNMGLFCLTKKGSSQAFEYLAKGNDELAELSRDILAHHALLQSSTPLQVQDADHLAQLAERCIAYGDSNQTVKPHIYRVVAACYDRIRGMLPNNPHLPDAEKFLAKNHQELMSFNPRSTTHGIEKIAGNVNLLAKGHTNGRQLRGGLGGFSIRGMQHEFAAHGKNDGYLMIPFREQLRSGYVLKMELLLGDQPEFKFVNKYVSACRLTFPVADHVLTLVMNEKDIVGAFEKDAVFGGLSAIDEQRLPPHARYEDILKPMKKTPVILLLRVMPHADDGLVDINLERSDGLTKEWTLPIKDCREETFYRDEKGNDHYGVGIGAASGIRFRELRMYAFEGGDVEIGDGQMQVANKQQN